MPKLMSHRLPTESLVKRKFTITNAAVDANDVIDIFEVADAAKYPYGTGTIRRIQTSITSTFGTALTFYFFSSLPTSATVGLPIEPTTAEILAFIGGETVPYVAPIKSTTKEITLPFISDSSNNIYVVIRDDVGGAWDTGAVDVTFWIDIQG